MRQDRLRVPAYPRPTEFRGRSGDLKGARIHGQVCLQSKTRTEYNKSTFEHLASAFLQIEPDEASKMQCSRCQHENPAAVKFCGECGARLELPCPSCRASNPPTNKFCNECGESLAQPASAPKFASPQNYTPKHLAEKILTSKSALEGERKQVTVLFADMKGSMELLADRDPEDARKLLDPVIEHMMEAVHRYEGTVNQVMGDGIMALFGAPLAHEDHAVRACYAALRMQESVKRYAEGVRRTEGIPIQIRVGLNSGEVVVRSIGSDLKMDYTAVGQTHTSGCAHGAAGDPRLHSHHG